MRGLQHKKHDFYRLGVESDAKLVTIKKSIQIIQELNSKRALTKTEYIKKIGDIESNLIILKMIFSE